MSEDKYGKYIVEYRKIKHGIMEILQKKIDDVDTAIVECNKLKDLGYHDVLIKKYEYIK